MFVFLARVESIFLSQPCFYYFFSRRTAESSFNFAPTSSTAAPPLPPPPFPRNCPSNFTGAQSLLTLNRKKKKNELVPTSPPQQPSLRRRPLLSNPQTRELLRCAQGVPERRRARPGCRPDSAAPGEEELGNNRRREEIHRGDVREGAGGAGEWQRV